MEPSVSTLGDLSNRRGVERCEATLQWSRAFQRSETSHSLHSPIARLEGFNGAERFNARRHPGDFDRLFVILRASMEPSVSTLGDCISRRTRRARHSCFNGAERFNARRLSRRPCGAVLLSLLQWSRAFQRSET